MAEQVAALHWFYRYLIDGTLQSILITGKTANGKELLVTSTIKAFWKDKNTMVIETRKESPGIIRQDQVSSFQYVIRIEYMEI